jgi:hypothetical protein
MKNRKVLVSRLPKIAPSWYSPTISLQTKWSYEFGSFSGNHFAPRLCCFAEKRVCRHKDSQRVGFLASINTLIPLALQLHEIGDLRKRYTIAVWEV